MRMIYSLTDRLHPAVIGEDILCYAQCDVTCYVIRGERGDMLIDTGLPQIWGGMEKWLAGYDIRQVFLTHAHVDHDYNAAKLQRKGARILLSERDSTLRQNFLSQRLKPTMPKYAPRNVLMTIGGGLMRSPAYTADIFGKDRSLLRRMGYDADIVPLPGHTYGSCGVYSSGVLYCGDAFTALWKRPDICPNAVSPGLMRRSLERIVKLSPKMLACGHGLPLRFDEAYPVIEEYLRRTDKDGRLIR